MMIHIERKFSYTLQLFSNNFALQAATYFLLPLIDLIPYGMLQVKLNLTQKYLWLRGISEIILKYSES